MRSFITLSKLMIMLVVCAGGAKSFQHENRAYLPLSAAEMSKRFTVRYVGTLGAGRPGYAGEKRDIRLPAKLDIGPAGASLTYRDDEDPFISGKDREGRDWQVFLGTTTSSSSCRFYVADLDRNRINDAILLCATGGNGLAPTSHLFTLTFDAQGRPVPFEAEGYFTDDAKGIFDLVDLDDDGRAELVYMNFDGGYWITNLYEADDARWQRVAGRLGRRSYPLYTRFTNRANRRPTQPRRGSNPFAPDLSNDVPKFRGRILSYKWNDVAQSEDVELTLSDVNGKETLCSPVSWYGSFGFVRDSEQGRTIIPAYGNEEETKALLDEAVGKKVDVVLYGQRRHDKCSPEWTWVVGRNLNGR